MKQFLFSFLMICSLQLYAQIKIPADLSFSTPFYEAENKYIVFSPRPEDQQLMIGVAYIDPAAGYSYRYYGTITVEDGKLKLVPAQENTDMIARWQNLALKVAVLSEARVKEFELANPPEFLKFYKSNKPEKDFLVDKLSFQNGAGYSSLALPKLEELRKEGFRSAKFYFELSFAYNALQQFSKAENAVNEAEKYNFHDELMIKEMHYALLHQDKLIPAADYLQKNFKNFQSKLYKSEGIVNQVISFFNNNDMKNAGKWIKIYKSEIVEDQYKTRIDDIENKLKEGQK